MPTLLLQSSCKKSQHWGGGGNATAVLRCPLMNVSLILYRRGQHLIIKKQWNFMFLKDSWLCFPPLCNVVPKKKNISLQREEEIHQHKLRSKKEKGQDTQCLILYFWTKSWRVDNGWCKQQWQSMGLSLQKHKRRCQHTEGVPKFSRCLSLMDLSQEPEQGDGRSNVRTSHGYLRKVREYQ